VVVDESNGCIDYLEERIDEERSTEIELFFVSGKPTCETLTPEREHDRKQCATGKKIDESTHFPLEH
jgi:hypothetical protein